MPSLPSYAGEARGLGATAHGEVSADDDPYEAYRKRMMLGYKYRWAESGRWGTRLS